MGAGIAIAKQDIYSLSEAAKIISEGKLPKGKYELDISDDGKIKVSKVGKRWIQKEDLG
jgi:hypothetical protein